MSKLWARPVAMFLEEIEVSGERVPRFKYVDDTQTVGTLLAV